MLSTKAVNVWLALTVVARENFFEGRLFGAVYGGCLTVYYEATWKVRSLQAGNRPRRVNSVLCPYLGWPTGLAHGGAWPKLLTALS